MYSHVGLDPTKDCDPSWRVDAAILARRGGGNFQDGEPALPGAGRQIGFTVGKAPVRTNAKSIFAAILRGEGEKAARREDTRNGGKNRGEIADVDEDIGGGDETGARLGLGLQKFDEICCGEPVVKAFFPRLKN